MSVNELSEDGWTLSKATSADIDELMSWFPQAEDVMIWGGPSFRYPFSRKTFFKDVYWGKMASFALRNSAGNFAAFGQVYERFSCINFARLVVNPTMRGRGIGKRLISQLMKVSAPMFNCEEYSLFVFRENTPAYECYKAMGFAVRDYPPKMPHADVCYYLTRPI